MILSLKLPLQLLFPSEIFFYVWAEFLTFSLKNSNLVMVLCYFSGQKQEMNNKFFKIVSRKLAEVSSNYVIVFSNYSFVKIWPQVKKYLNPFCFACTLGLLHAFCTKLNEYSYRVYQSEVVATKCLWGIEKSIFM